MPFALRHCRPALFETSPTTKLAIPRRSYFGRGANTTDVLFEGTWANLFTGATFKESGEFTRSVALQLGEVAVFVKRSNEGAKGL
jgi:hypothetical protein